MACKNTEYVKAWQKRNPEKVKENEKNRKPRHPDSNRAYKYKTIHNLTIEEYDKIFEKQEGCCAICLKHQNNFKRHLSIDHNHITNINRALLCHNCNLGLGQFKDSIELLRRAALYLEEYNG